MIKKICAISGKEFFISDKDLEYYKKLSVPLPTLCPGERARRRMAIRNERNLYKRKSDFTGENILSMYHSDSPYPVYEKDIWISDKWDAIKYGRDIDFAKPFFEQFYELQKVVPRANLAIFVNNENSEYCNFVGDIKNCYLCFGSIFIEDCMYGNPYYSKNCVDCFLVRKSELCYECIDCDSLYNCMYCQECYSCNDTFFSYDMRGCHNCFGCVGLRNKEYYMFNKPYKRDDYGKFFKEFSFCDKEKVKFAGDKMSELKMLHPHRAVITLNSENITGNYIFNSKDCFDCFQIMENQDCSYNIQTTTSKDCYDMNYTEENELCYEYLGNYRNNKALFSAICYGCHDIWYSDYLTNCKHCFGCVGLKNKEYCILNKQYSREEYEEMVPRIIRHMSGDTASARRERATSEESGSASSERSELTDYGEFFPIKYSPFTYNESVAYDYFPLNKKEALSRGYRWRDEDSSEFKTTTYIPPSNIEDVSDSICDEILSCEISGRNYRITPAELKFYRKMKLPIPRKHFFERLKARLSKRLPYELFDRKCDKCGENIKTAYSSNRPEKIYCEKCYLKII